METNDYYYWLDTLGCNILPYLADPVRELRCSYHHYISEK